MKKIKIKINVKVIKHIDFSSCCIILSHVLSNIDLCC